MQGRWCEKAMELGRRQKALEVFTTMRETPSVKVRRLPSMLDLRWAVLCAFSVRAAMETSLTAPCAVPPALRSLVR